MFRAFMIASLTAFAAVAVNAASRDVAVPTPNPSEEIVGTPSDEQGAVSNFSKPVEEKSQKCGCNKPKKAKR
jgi:uncharacterized protein (DUF2147 family)